MIAGFERHLAIFTIAFFGVALVLLAIVFSTTPMYDDGPRVNLPWARTATVLQASERDLNIRLTARDRTFVGPMLVLPQDLEAVLRDIHRRSPNHRVVIEADGSLPFGRIQSTIGAASRAGFHDIYLVTFRGTPLQAHTRKVAGG